MIEYIPLLIMEAKKVFEETTEHFERLHNITISEGFRTALLYDYRIFERRMMNLAEEEIERYTHAAANSRGHCPI